MKTRVILTVSITLNFNHSVEWCTYDCIRVAKGQNVHFFFFTRVIDFNKFILFNLNRFYTRYDKVLTVVFKKINICTLLNL